MLGLQASEKTERIEAEAQEAAEAFLWLSKETSKLVEGQAVGRHLAS